MTYKQLKEYIESMTEHQQDMPVVLLFNQEYIEPNMVAVVDMRADPEYGYGEDQPILL
jgi:hypothetical protein